MSSIIDINDKIQELNQHMHEYFDLRKKLKEWDDDTNTYEYNRYELQYLDEVLNIDMLIRELDYIFNAQPELQIRFEKLKKQYLNSLVEKKDSNEDKQIFNQST